MDLRNYFEKYCEIESGQPGPWLKARCPFPERHKHDDKTPSLGCHIETGGLRCHGCSLKGSIFKLWESLDLPESPSTFAGNGAGSGPLPLVYPYRNADGSAIYTVYRKPPKRFWVEPKGVFQKVDRVPFMLPEMLATDTDVFISEGEKDCLTVAAMGFCSTATVGGSSRTDFRQEAPYFEGRDCVIIPDADTPGRAYAANLAKSLAPYARSVKILQLPDLEPDSGQDVSDWAAKFDTLTDAGEELSRLADQAVEIRLQEIAQEPEPDVLEAVKPLPYSYVQEITALEIPPQKWIVRDLIPAGEIGFCYGDSKLGKSFMIFDMCLHIERGEPWLEMFATEHVRTLFLAREDPDRRIQERQNTMLQGYGFREQEEKTFAFVMREPFDLMEERDFASLLQTIEETRAEFVILDVLAMMIGGIEENSAREFGRVVKALEALRDYRPEPLTILCVDHTRKNLPGSSGDTEISPHDLRGSGLKRGAADYLISFSEKIPDRQFRVIGENKDSDPCPDFLMNRSPKGSPGPKHTYAGGVEELATESRGKGDTNREHVFEVVTEAPQSAKEIAAVVEGVGDSAARDHLAKLVQGGRVERVGSGPKVKYQLLSAKLPLGK